ncbi:MAG: hypothetical protein CMN80_13210 [Spongiibacter sp.]|nr:hypothetical protein [Spongiibacter sp.]
MFLTSYLFMCIFPFALRRIFAVFAAAIVLAACSQKPIAFTDYTVQELLKINIAELAEPAFFELESVEVLNKNDGGESASADVYVTLRFPEDFDTVVGMRKLAPFNMEYKQYKSSFGSFKAGETQRHHARYQFVRRDGKWFIAGSKALSAPKIERP